jgi:hypothetical protein
MCGWSRRIDPQRAGRPLRRQAGALDGLADLRERRRQALQQLRARLRQADAARRPVEQPHVHLRFQYLDGARDRRRRDAHFLRGAREVHVPRHALKHEQPRQGGAALPVLRQFSVVHTDSIMKFLGIAYRSLCPFSS